MAITLKRNEKRETQVVSMRVDKAIALEWSNAIKRAGLQEYSVREICNDTLVNATAQLKKAMGDNQAKGYEALQNGSAATDR